MGILVISNRNSVRVLSVKALPCILCDKYINISALEMASAPCQLYRPQWRRNYGDRGVHCTPQVQDLYSLYPLPPSQRCGLHVVLLYMLVCQNFKRTTLTTRLYEVHTNLYPPPNYENVPTLLISALQ